MANSNESEIFSPEQIDALFKQNRSGEAYYSLAANAWLQGQWQQVIEHTLEAQKNGIDNAEVWHLLGCAYGQTGDEQTALNAFQVALQREPGHINSLFLTAQIFYKRGNTALCWQHTQRILQKEQTHTPALLLGVRCLLRLCEPEIAEKLIKILLLQQPNNPEILNLSGSICSALKQYAQAKLFYQQSIQADPGMVSAWQNLGHEHYRDKSFIESQYCYMKAAELAPHCTEIQILALNAADKIADWSKRNEQLSHLLLALQSDENIQTPFAFITKLDDPMLQLRITRACARNMLPALTEPAPIRRIPSRKGLLTVGYLSADIYSHATAILIAELFSLHNRAQFVVYLYHYGNTDDSPVRQRILQSADKSLDVSHLNTKEITAQIKQDGVDILIDLKGWTTDHHLDVLAQRPAPLQIHYLGYPGTIGSDFIDYLVSDSFITPPSSAANFHEALLVLPGCYQINDRQREQDTCLTRHAYNLPENAFVFADFNQPYKITPQIFDIWLRILQACPDSILWLLDHNPDATHNLRTYAACNGVNESRLIFSPKQSIRLHVARLALADLMLDTSPVNGHTTTSDALWAGVPVLTISGHTFISRVAGSLLCNARLPELVCKTPKEYEQRAITLYNDPTLLLSLRKRLEKREGLPLYDTPRWVSEFEQGLYTTWTRHAAGLSPKRIDVKASKSTKQMY